MEISHAVSDDREREGSDETPKERRDRELGELLQELRVALPGVQVLFAFLLTVPFSHRFTTITSTQKNAYFTAFICATIASLLLIAPTVLHRVQFREGDKEGLLKISNRLALVGSVFLAAAIATVVFVITDIVFGAPASTILLVVAALLFGGVWYGLPLARKMRTTSHD